MEVAVLSSSDLPSLRWSAASRPSPISGLFLERTPINNLRHRRNLRIDRRRHAEKSAVMDPLALDPGTGRHRLGQSVAGARRRGRSGDGRVARDVSARGRVRRRSAGGRAGPAQRRRGRRRRLAGTDAPALWPHRHGRRRRDVGALFADAARWASLRPWRTGHEGRTGRDDCRRRAVAARPADAARAASSSPPSPTRSTRALAPKCSRADGSPTRP